MCVYMSAMKTIVYWCIFMFKRCVFILMVQHTLKYTFF